VNAVQMLLFYFIIYSFIGWIIEGVFNLYTNGSFKKQNFLLSPIKPMYGFAAVLLVLSNQWLPFGLFMLMAFIIPTFIEYISAWLMDYLFKIKFWDYSSVPNNYKGYICLRFSLYWILLSMVLVFMVHPAIYTLYHFSSSAWALISPIVILYLLFDFTLTLIHASQKFKNRAS
jgi:uncharacterized membrane protein